MEENKFYVYRHVRLDTNVPFYIGIGTKSYKYHGHKSEYRRAYVGYKRTAFWNAIVAKTDYRVDILFESSDLEEIKQKEIEFIKLYGRRNLNEGTLVNLTDGGDYSIQQASQYKKKFKHTQEAKDKISKIQKGRKTSKETREVLSQLHKDKESHLRLQTPEALEKAKRSRRNNSPRVMDVTTGEIYNSLPDACEILGEKLVTAQSRIYRGLKTSRFIYIDESKRKPRTKKPK
jgi:hypothetical protein